MAVGLSVVFYLIGILTSARAYRDKIEALRAQVVLLALLSTFIVINQFLNVR